MGRDFAREMTKQSLTQELNKVRDNYMAIYDEYYETNSRNSAFLKDLADAIIGISAVFEVYVRDRYIHPNYALEKLYFSQSYIKSTIDYFERLLEKENESDK